MTQECLVAAPPGLTAWKPVEGGARTQTQKEMPRGLGDEDEV